MKSFLTLSSLILSFAIHAVFSRRLHPVSKALIAECYYDEKPPACLQADYFVADTSEDLKWCCLKIIYSDENIGGHSIMSSTEISENFSLEKITNTEALNYLVASSATLSSSTSESHESHEMNGSESEKQKHHWKVFEESFYNDDHSYITNAWGSDFISLPESSENEFVSDDSEDSSKVLIILSSFNDLNSTHESVLVSSSDVDKSESSHEFESFLSFFSFTPSSDGSSSSPSESFEDSSSVPETSYDTYSSTSSNVPSNSIDLEDYFELSGETTGETLDETTGETVNSHTFDPENNDSNTKTSETSESLPQSLSSFDNASDKTLELNSMSESINSESFTTKSTQIMSTVKRRKPKVRTQDIKATRTKTPPRPATTTTAAVKIFTRRSRKPKFTPQMSSEQNEITTVQTLSSSSSDLNLDSSLTSSLSQESLNIHSQGNSVTFTGTTTSLNTENHATIARHETEAEEFQNVDTKFSEEDFKSDNEHAKSENREEIYEDFGDGATNLGLRNAEDSDKDISYDEYVEQNQINQKNNENLDFDDETSSSLLENSKESDTNLQPISDSSSKDEEFFSETEPIQENLSSSLFEDNTVLNTNSISSSESEVVEPIEESFFSSETTNNLNESFDEDFEINEDFKPLESSNPTYFEEDEEKKKSESSVSEEIFIVKSSESVKEERSQPLNFAPASVESKLSESSSESFNNNIEIVGAPLHDGGDDFNVTQLENKTFEANITASKNVKNEDFNNKKQSSKQSQTTAGDQNEISDQSDFDTENLSGGDFHHEDDPKGAKQDDEFSDEEKHFDEEKDFETEIESEVDVENQEETSHETEERQQINPDRNERVENEQVKDEVTVEKRQQTRTPKIKTNPPVNRSTKNPKKIISLNVNNAKSTDAVPNDLTVKDSSRRENKKTKSNRKSLVKANVGTIANVNVL